VIVVPDAGPLIYLASAGQLDLLGRLFDDVVVPEIVFREVTVAGVGLAGASEVIAATWLRIVQADPDPSLLDLIDRGEAAAIPLAERLGATLLVDDSAARMIAMERGLQVLGTLGVLLRGKREGHVDAVGPIIVRMRSLGMYVGVDLWRQVLRLADESE
jgi:predicted nucleic acid-binding protein